MPRPLRIGLTVLAGTLACGLPLWPLSYREVNMGGKPEPSTWLILGAIAGLIGGYLIRPGLRAPILAVGAGFVLAVMARVVWETTADPTSHNLWPFEVVFVAFFGVVAGLIGVGLARGIQRVTASR